MSLQAAKDTFSVWKMAILKVSLLTFVAGAMVFQTAMSGLKWELLSGSDKFMILLGVLIAMANNLVSFLDKTISRIEGEQKDLQTQTDTESVSVQHTLVPAVPPITPQNQTAPPPPP